MSHRYAKKIPSCRLNSPLGWKVGQGVGKRSRWELTANTPLGNRAALPGSHRHGIPGGRMAACAPLGSAPHEEQEAAGEHGAHLVGHTSYRGDRGMARESPPRMSQRIYTPSPLGWRATPALSESEARLVINLLGKTRRAGRWENGARHPWGYSRLTNRCSCRLGCVSDSWEGRSPGFASRW